MNVEIGHPTLHKTGQTVDELIVRVNGIRILADTDDEFDELFFDALMALQAEAIIGLDDEDTSA